MRRDIFYHLRVLALYIEYFFLVAVVIHDRIFFIFREFDVGQICVDIAQWFLFLQKFGCPVVRNCGWGAYQIGDIFIEHLVHE